MSECSITVERKFYWNDTHAGVLREMWAKGYSASQIAGELSRNTGLYVSRNAVIGKKSRLGLEARPQDAAHVRAARASFGFRRPSKPSGLTAKQVRRARQKAHS